MILLFYEASHRTREGYNLKLQREIVNGNTTTKKVFFLSFYNKLEGYLYLFGKLDMKFVEINIEYVVILTGENLSSI